MHKSDQKESAQETSDQSQSRSLAEMQFDARKKKKKTVVRVVEELQKELQRHCEEVHTDQGETREVQEKRIEYFKKKGDRHFTDDGRGAEITVDLVLQGKDV